MANGLVSNFRGWLKDQELPEAWKKELEIAENKGCELIVFRIPISANSLLISEIQEIILECEKEILSRSRK